MVETACLSSVLTPAAKHRRVGSLVVSALLANRGQQVGRLLELRGEHDHRGGLLAQQVRERFPVLGVHLAAR
jgi:hypothetical protein